MVSFCQYSLFPLLPVSVISFSFPLFLIFSSFHGTDGFPSPHEEDFVIGGLKADGENDGLLLVEDKRESLALWSWPRAGGQDLTKKARDRGDGR
ncbi:uncharacterized [Tachysurus ichikawai]